MSAFVANHIGYKVPLQSSPQRRIKIYYHPLFVSLINCFSWLLCAVSPVFSAADVFPGASFSAWHPSTHAFYHRHRNRWRIVLYGFSTVWETQSTSLTPDWPTDIYRTAPSVMPPPLISWRLLRKCKQLQYCPEVNIIRKSNPRRKKISTIMLSKAKYK